MGSNSSLTNAIKKIQVGQRTTVMAMSKLSLFLSLNKMQVF